jgi:hypothetical protein
MEFLTTNLVIILLCIIAVVSLLALYFAIKAAYRANNAWGWACDTNVLVQTMQKMDNDFKDWTHKQWEQWKKIIEEQGEWHSCFNKEWNNFYSHYRRNNNISDAIDGITLFNAVMNTIFNRKPTEEKPPCCGKEGNPPVTSEEQPQPKKSNKKKKEEPQPEA